MAQMTRQEIETRLEEKYLGRVISIVLPLALLNRCFEVAGKIQRIAVDITEAEPIVVFVLSPGGRQYKADINYFIENTTIHGDPH